MINLWRLITVSFDMEMDEYYEDMEFRKSKNIFITGVNSGLGKS